MLKKLLIAGGVGLVVYVVNEMRKQYDKNVEDYNSLLDFIEKHDFYKKHDSYDDKNSRYSTETKVMPDGKTYSVKKDVASGFSVISCKNA